MKLKSFGLVSSLLVMILMTGCTGGGGGYVSTAERFVDELNYYYATGYSDEFFLVKEHGAYAHSYAVVYDSVLGEYVAFNLAFYYPGMSMNQYLNTAHEGDIHRWLTPIGGGLYEGDYGMIFEETTATSKDLEKIGHFMEEKKITTQGEKLAAEFGLSEERGIQIAKLASEWNKLKKKRSMTDKDANAFSKKALGFDLNEATKAYKKSMEGNDSHLQELMKKAAELNESTPERMNKVFREILNK